MAPETKEITSFNLKAVPVGQDPDIVYVPKVCWEVQSKEVQHLLSIRIPGSF